MTASHQLRGIRGEDLAEEHLAASGLVVIDRNWRCRHGELDLVAVDGDGTLVFCEVKLRRGTGFGDPLEALTYAKVRRLRRLVGLWLAAHPGHRGAIRLDAIGIVARPGRLPVVRHEKGIDA